jgi:phenylacetate-CoA ligase
MTRDGERRHADDVRTASEGTTMSGMDRPARRRPGVRTPAAASVGLLRTLWLTPLDLAFRALGLRYAWMKALFTWTPPAVLRLTGRLRAERAAWRATTSVPAYADLLATRGIDPSAMAPLGILGRLPETDKASYIDRYRIEERCVGGSFPFAGTTIDESSGSTGHPYDWIRSAAERSVAHRNIGFFARYCFGPGPLLTLNALSMGAWAAGINMSLGMNRHGLVKSIGPDTGRILTTLRSLGPGYRYQIAGYPPFLKHLLDVGDAEDFPWPDYDLLATVGGEGMTEELRDYLLDRFVSCYSGYGATDLEVGIAAETPVSIAVRRLARARPDIRTALFGDDPRLPMVFQYNPLLHWIEVTRDRELVFTISRLDLLSPRIRYNIHDQGGVMPFKRLEAALRDIGYDLRTLGEREEVWGPRGRLPWVEVVPLPFLWVNGRRDATISIMGANIYPEDVESQLFRQADIARVLSSFQLRVGSDVSGTPRPAVDLEMTLGATLPPERLGTLAEQLREGLAEVNRDYRQSLSEYPDALLPLMTSWAKGTGPFAGDAQRIKQRRLA